MKSVKSMKQPSKTDWKRIDSMRDEDIDFSDIPKMGPDFFKNAILWPGTKEQITLRIDPDVLTFFRKQGRGYQTAMNAVLRKYMEAQAERKGGVEAQAGGVRRAGRQGGKRQVQRSFARKARSG